VTEIRLLYEPGNVEERPENEGIYEQQDPEKLLRRVKEAGVEYSVANVADLSREELEDLYTRLAVTPSVRKRYRVKRIFGTNKYPGSRFGKGVPALVVLEGGRPQDVYPHEEEGGRIVTIKEYLDSLGKERRRGAALARRMDELRGRIGRVGVSTRDLINEGRRR
jgi:hypothetical protein